MGDTVPRPPSGEGADAGIGLVLRLYRKSGDAYLLHDHASDSLLVWTHAFGESVGPVLMLIPERR